MKKIALLVLTLIGLFLIAGAANMACETPNIVEGLRACTTQIVIGAILLLPGLWKVVTNR